MKPKIQRLVKGTTPTLLEEVKGNELIDRVNALGAITISRGTKDAVVYGSDGTHITYKFPPDGWEEKTVELCEDGETVAYTFLVQASVG